MPFKSDYIAVSHPKRVLDVILTHIESFDIKTHYVPSVAWVSDGIDHKRLVANREDFPFDPKKTNFPAFIYSRTPLVVSSEIGNWRRFDVKGVPDYESGTAGKLKLGYGFFTISWAMIFNNIADLEDFEVLYLSEGLLSSFRDFQVSVLGIENFANLSVEERSFSVGSEWQMFSSIETVRFPDHVYFALGGQAQITAPIMSVSKNVYDMIREIQVSFYGSDLSMNIENKEFMYRVIGQLDENGNPTKDIVEFVPPPYTKE